MSSRCVIKFYLTRTGSFIISNSRLKINILFKVTKASQNQKPTLNYKVFTGKIKDDPSTSKDIKFVADYYAFLGVYQHNSEYFAIVVNQANHLGELPDGKINLFQLGQVQTIYLNDMASGLGKRTQGLEKLIKFLSSGTFYFSDESSYDDSELITAKKPNNNWTLCAKSMFLWNRSLLTKFLKSPKFTDQNESDIQFYYPELDKICTRIINGSISLKHLYSGAAMVCCLLISRLSLNRVGTRYKTRGIDDYGNVANFVETNQVIFGVGNNNENQCSIFTQIRGSIPVYWAQPGMNIGAHNIYFTRKNPLNPKDCQINQVAVKSHFDQLQQMYPNKGFIALNLVKQSPGGERDISDEFRRCLVGQESRVQMINFDLHTHKDRDEAMERLIDQRPELTDFRRQVVRFWGWEMV